MALHLLPGNDDGWVHFYIHFYEYIKIHTHTHTIYIYSQAMPTQEFSIRRNKQHVINSHSAEQHSQVSDGNANSQIFRVCVPLSSNFNPDILCHLWAVLFQTTFLPFSMGNVQAGSDFLISSFCGVTALYHLRRELKCHHAGCMHNAIVRNSVSSPTTEYLYRTSDWIPQWSLGLCCVCDFLHVHNKSITDLKYLSHLEMTKSQGTSPSHDPKLTWQHILATLDTSVINRF